MASPVNRPDNPAEEQGLPNTIHTSQPACSTGGLGQPPAPTTSAPGQVLSDSSYRVPQGQPLWGHGRFWMVPQWPHHRAQLSPATQLGVPLWKYLKQRGKLLHWQWRKKCEETALWPARSEMEGRRCSSHWSRDPHAQPTERSTAEETSTAQPTADLMQEQGDAPWRMVAHGKGPCWTREKGVRHKGWQRGAVTDLPHYSTPCTTQECCFISQNPDLF